MSKFWDGVLKFVIQIVRGILPLMSDNLRDLISEWIIDFREKSRETKNPWDDLIADFLYEIFIGG